MNILEISQVTAGYGNPQKKVESPKIARVDTDSLQVLKDISFSVPEGRNVCILGANGSGKTTLLRVLAGVLPYIGSVRISGKDIRRMKRREIAGQLALMPQFSEIYFSYSVRETVMLGRYLHMKSFFGTPGTADKEAVEEAMEATGLKDLAEHQIGELSGGQRQRVFLARTFAQHTPVILLDEPTNHLDLRYQAELMEYLADWSVKKTTLADGSIRQNTVVGVFHDINLGMRIAQDVVFLKNGRIIAKGDKKEIIRPALLQEVYDMDVVNYMKQQLAGWNEIGSEMYEK